MKAQPLKGRPLVSVVVPCYNYGRYLPDAVGSVLDQPGVDVEVIIVDDASTDDSVSVARRLAVQDPRVRLIEHQVNRGHVATYNDGLSRVTGDLVVLLSADDMLAPGALARAAALFEVDPEVGLVYGYAAEFSDSSGAVAAVRRRRAWWSVWSGKEWIALSCWRGRNFILSPEAVIRVKALEAVGGYNPALPHSGDLEFWLRTAAHWSVGRVNGPAQAFYRIHPGNMHIALLDSAAADIIHRAAAFRSLQNLSERGHWTPYVHRAERALAREALLVGQRRLDEGGGALEARTMMSSAVDVSAAAGGSLRARILERSITRAEQDLRPSDIQRAAEWIRRQFDRVRWTLWKMVGVS
ncbi:glycosyltransferase family 2 protein [Sinomonas atrocyanea]|uniref:glycosyltransferase family 2 protein n=1 Tax=Sinomonas atrocyanea TaxID=37927 RepID=UPI003D966992